MRGIAASKRVLGSVVLGLVVGLAARSWVYTSDAAGPWWGAFAFTVLSLGAALCVPALRDATAEQVRDLPVGDIAALNNSFGFGGANVAVVYGSI
jgi:3-oxoacyl-(acyl-carrier-protein) synthase